MGIGPARPRAVVSDPRTRPAPPPRRRTRTAGSTGSQARLTSAGADPCLGSSRAPRVRVRVAACQRCALASGPDAPGRQGKAKNLGEDGRFRKRFWDVRDGRGVAPARFLGGQRLSLPLLRCASIRTDGRRRTEPALAVGAGAPIATAALSFSAGVFALGYTCAVGATLTACTPLFRAPRQLLRT